jgi:cytochrome c-type biogenesis protein CcmE
MLAVYLAAQGTAIAARLTLRAFQKNMMFFVEISDVAAGNHPTARNFRIGGLVVDGSVQHDEDYMAPEVADSLAKHVQDKSAAVVMGGGEYHPDDS